ncbi:MAG: hypothetical protein QM683_09370 [Lacrimispora sp.]
MEQIYHEDHTEPFLIRGLVRYRDCTPVRGAVVILEKVSSVYNEEKQKEECRESYVNHALTNPKGEFCFAVTDKKSSYKIKIFDNHHR